MIFTVPSLIAAAATALVTEQNLFIAPLFLQIIPTLDEPMPPLVNTRTSPPVPILEVIKVYGSLAGPECYGKLSPPGSTCQIPLRYLEQELGLSSPTSTLSYDKFQQLFQGNQLNGKSLEFQWPLKPYGVDGSPSLGKTAVMNKGAETAIYMNQLESRGLYDRRNPAGPLPTSLRPQLNKQIQKEGITDAQVIKRAFDVLADPKRGLITQESIRNAYQEKDALDYYSFLEIIGKESIQWQ
jgi:hypothetical protein